MCQIIKNYRDNEVLRHSFNSLAKKTFGINFEDWYQNGYWTDRYKEIEDNTLTINMVISDKAQALNMIAAADGAVIGTCIIINMGWKCKKDVESKASIKKINILHCKLMIQMLQSR